MTETPRPKIAPEVLTATVWDAIKTVPGVVELHRGPSLGKVLLERRGPVRLLDEETPPTLEVHLVVAAGQPIPAIAEEVHGTLRRFMASTLGMHQVVVRLYIDDIAEAPPA